MVLSAMGMALTSTFIPPTAAGGLRGERSAPDPAVLPAALEPLSLVAGSGPGSASPTPSPFGGVSIESRDHAAAFPEPPDPPFLTGYRWPVRHGRLTLPFGPSEWGSRIVQGEKFHDGIDLATFCGDRIVAAHDGVVLAAGRRYDTVMGWVGDLQPYLDRLDEKFLGQTLPIVVVVDDGNDYRSIYAHLSETAVQRGDIVTAGQLLGYEGATGRASGCHLHYGLFSPLETNRFGIDSGIVERMLLPPYQIARIDPLGVLPSRSAAPKPTRSETAKPPLE